MQDLAGLSVLITGGGSGLGRGAALHLARKGARVTISGRRREIMMSIAVSIACRSFPSRSTLNAPIRRVMNV